MVELSEIVAGRANLRATNNENRLENGELARRRLGGCWLRKNPRRTPCERHGTRPQARSLPHCGQWRQQPTQIWASG